MTTEPESDVRDSFAEALVRHRPLLLMLARMLCGRVARPFRNQIDPSDVVQESLLHAHRDRDQFGGATDDKLAAWLRQILRHRFQDVLRKLKVPLKHRVEVEKTSRRIEDILSGGWTSPSERAIKVETLLRLAEALEQLDQPQQDAVRLRHLNGCSLVQIADQLERSESAVAGLIHRGLKRLRELMPE